MTSIVYWIINSYSLPDFTISLVSTITRIFNAVAYIWFLSKWLSVHYNVSRKISNKTTEYLILLFETNLQLYNHSMIFAFYFQETICHHHQYDIQVWMMLLEWFDFWLSIPRNMNPSNVLPARIWNLVARLCLKHWNFVWIRNIKVGTLNVQNIRIIF